MRLFGRIETGMWNNPRVRKLSDNGKLLWTYLLACPHGNSLGCFVVHDGYVAADLGWATEQVSKQVSELVSIGLIERDETTSLVRIIGWFGHNTIENGKVAIAADKVLRSLPRCAVFYALIQELKRDGNKFLGKYVMGIETGSETSIDTPEPEPEPEPEPSHPLTPSPASDAVRPHDDQTASPGRPGRRTTAEESARLDQYAVVMADQFLHQHAIYWPDEGELRMARMPLLTLRAEAREWIEAGVDLELFIDVLDKRMAVMAATGKSPPRSIKAFHLSLHDALAARMAG